MPLRSQQLRVLRVARVPDDRIGGMSRTMYATGDCLAARGHRIEYVFAPAFRWRTPQRLVRYSSCWEAAVRVLRALHQGRSVDVVELHESLTLGYGVARRRNPKLPPMVAFSYGLEERGHLAWVEYRRKKATRIPAKNRAASWMSALQSRMGIHLASQIICSSSEDVAFLTQRRSIPSDRVVLHRSGVEPAFLEATPPPVGPRQSALLFVGSWIERKGIQDLVPAVSRVLAQKKDARFTAAGCRCGPESILPLFPEVVRAQIAVIPQLDSVAELIALYGRHGVLVLPSYFEGHPLVMVEAAALGLAIVTTSVCGMRDFIEPGVTGVFVPVASPSRLSEALLTLLSHPERIAQLGAAARRAAESHTWASATASIERAYLAAALSRRTG